MNRKNILIVSNPDTMNNELFGWISTTEDFDMSFAQSHEHAIELANQQIFDLVLIDKTDTDVNAKMLKAVMPILNSDTMLVDYDGEEAVMIAEKVREAFEIRKLKRIQKMMILDSSNEGRHYFMHPFSLN